MSFASYAPTTGQPVDADTIRVGVIGTGFGASLHLSALRECPGFTGEAAKAPGRLAMRGRHDTYIAMHAAITAYALDGAFGIGNA